jgi:hypothetical protein
MGLTKSLYADLSCEEVFELERHCDELREENIRAMEADVHADDTAADADRREAEDRERDLAVAEDARCRAYRRAWGWQEVWQTVLAKGHELTRPA